MFTRFPVLMAFLLLTACEQEPVKKAECYDFMEERDEDVACRSDQMLRHEHGVWVCRCLSTIVEVDMDEFRREGCLKQDPKPVNSAIPPVPVVGGDTK